MRASGFPMQASGFHQRALDFLTQVIKLLPAKIASVIGKGEETLALDHASPQVVEPGAQLRSFVF